MKKLVLITLIILTVSLISGCAATKPDPEIQVVYVNKYIKCPAPEQPVYGKLNNEIHVGHLGNLEMLRTNLEKAFRYVDSLEATLTCYEQQTKE